MTERFLNLKEALFLRCNFCGLLLEEIDLKFSKDGKEFLRGCPECETDEYLIELTREDFGDGGEE